MSDSITGATMPELLSPKDLADLMGVSIYTVYAWNSDGSAPPRFKKGRVIRYRKADVLRWLADQTQGAA